MLISYKKFAFLFFFSITVIYQLESQNHKIDSLEKQLQLANNDSIKFNVYNELCFAVCKTNPTLAVDYAHKAIKLAKKNKSLNNEGEIYRVLGITYKGISQYDSAHYYLDKGINIAISIKNKMLEARCLNSLGNLYGYESKQNEALEAYLKSLKIREDLGDSVSAIVMLNNIGLLHSENHNYDKALEYINRAKQMAENIDNKENLCYALGNLSNIYVHKNQFETAKKYELQALQLEREIQLEPEIRVSLSSMGNICTQLHDYEAAQKYYNEGLEMAEKAQDKDLIVTLYTGLAKLAENQKNWQKEIQYGEIALKKSLEIKTLQGMKDAYECLYKGYEASGQYQKALEYHILLNQANDSLFSVEKNDKMLELQTKYEVNKKETENQLLRKEKDLKTLKIRQQTGFIIFSLITLFLIAFLSFMLYRNSQKEKKINAILGAQKTALEAQNQQLADLNAVKNKLFSIISHDLRTPLNSLKGLLSLLNTESLTQEQAKNIFPKITQNVGYTSELLESLLLWANNQLQGINRNPQKIDIQTLVNDNITLLKSGAIEKNIRIENDINTPVYVFADEDMLRITLRNLISNAIKFTKNEGEIHISVRYTNKEVEICIIDTGIGMSYETVQQLFKEHITTRGTKNEKGTGLGLMMVSDFVAQNKGRIWVESELGKGSNFTFTVPSA